MASAVVDSHLHVRDGTAAGPDPGLVKVGYSHRATASVALFMVPREATCLSKKDLHLVMDGTAERLWFG